jgi:hypothetical protein
LQVLVQLSVRIRHALFPDDPFSIYIHDIVTADDFAKALEHYGTWKHKWYSVKYIYEEQYRSVIENPELQDAKERVFISRDETSQQIQNRGVPSKLLRAVGQGKQFELVVIPSMMRRLIATLLLGIVLTVDYLIYCKVLP